MTDEWATELAQAELYETLTGGDPPCRPPALAPGGWIAAGTPLGVLPDPRGVLRTVAARRAGYLVATRYDTRANRTTYALAPSAARPRAANP